VVTGYLVRDLLNVPLKVRDKVIGVLGVDNLAPGGGFSENDEYLLSTLADYAAIAIDNANLYWLMDQRAEELTQLITARDERTEDREVALSEQSARLEARQHEFVERHTRLTRLSEQLSDLATRLNDLVTEVEEADSGRD
jgi:GAF domain-containing protein